LTDSEPSGYFELDAVGELAETILKAVRQEYPNDLRHPMLDADDRPLPHEIHPSFYGCYDWHSAVEMHWALVRLLRIAPEQVPETGIRAVLNEHLVPDRIAVEAAYFETHRAFKRPYGWGWALMLVDEVERWDDPDSRRWTAALEPLAAVLERRFLEWLPNATYPQREGVHGNSAFGLARALPWARRHSAALATVISDAAERWFADDRNYPAAWEPSGADFLSPALAEAELMAQVSDRFVDWFEGFLPEIPAALLEPATVSDSADPQIAHLHGLNLSKAHCWTEIARALPSADPRTDAIHAAVASHIDAALPQVIGGDYMVEHWLAAYALLALSSIARR
jgi:hypothetical protein